MTAWQRDERRGTARSLHGAAPAALAADRGELERRATVLEVTDRALVLGSAQPLAHADLEYCSSVGVDVVRRRSGGAAVLVEPAALIWVDLVVPAGDPLWCADVGKAAWWVGEAWARALGAAGVGGLEVWKGALQRRRWSDRVCFAGTGAGEVVLASTGAKVVGICQRRTRAGALFQCACLLRWEPQALLALLALGDAERSAAAAELPPLAMGVGLERSQRVLDSLLAELPQT